MASSPIEVVFVNLIGKKLECGVEPDTEASDIIEGLIQQNFIDKPDSTSSYSLHIERTKKAIAPSETAAQAGLKDGDTVKILAIKKGAHGDGLDA